MAGHLSSARLNRQLMQVYNAELRLKLNIHLFDRLVEIRSCFFENLFACLILSRIVFLINAQRVQLRAFGRWRYVIACLRAWKGKVGEAASDTCNGWQWTARTDSIDPCISSTCICISNGDAGIQSYAQNADTVFPVIHATSHHHLPGRFYFLFAFFPPALSTSTSFKLTDLLLQLPLSAELCYNLASTHSTNKFHVNYCEQLSRRRESLFASRTCCALTVLTVYVSVANSSVSA